ncbi:MAG: hypothetical protein NTX25_20770 [Proteobacteria bacterium]|nr:hypothetical protein [Pseudomonadota bacterium]
MYTQIAAHCLRFLLFLRHPWTKLKVLSHEHKAAAVELLSQEFCQREPLCRQLGLKIDEIRPFFTELVESVIKQKLGVVALSWRGELLGVLTNEDHFDRMEPQGHMNEALSAIGDYLDSIKIPEALEPAKRGELFHSGLAAVCSKNKNKAVLSMMILFSGRVVKRLGYKSGYAKVTNAAIARRFRSLERIARSEVFHCAAEVKPADFMRQGARPFQNLKGRSYLFVWKVL